MRTYTGTIFTQTDFSPATRTVAEPSGADRVEFLMDIDATYTEQHPNAFPKTLVALNDKHPFNFIGLEENGGWASNKVVLTDADNAATDSKAIEDYTLDVDVTSLSTIEYDRYFAPTMLETWQPFFLPFEFTVPDTWKVVELDRAEFDSNEDAYVLHWKDAPENLQPNTPYAIKLEQTGALTINGVNDLLLKAAEPMTCYATAGADDGAQFTVYGTYSTIDDLTGSFSDSAYTLDGELFMQAGAGSTVNPFRIYLIASLPAGSEMPSVIINKMDDGGGVHTAIDSIAADRDVKVYNLQGVQVKAENLPAGIYIIGGKKVVVR